MARRGAGEEERPPVGLKALPQVVLPDIYGEAGMMKTGSFRYSKDSQQESTAAAYAGLLATLVATPLGFCSRRRRAVSVFWAAAGLFGLSWALNVPAFVQLLRLPGLNMLSHNRWVFVTCFAILSLAAIGLDVLRKGELRWTGWLWIPLILLAALYVWCSYRALFLPEPIATQLELVVRQGRQIGWIRNLADVQQVQAAFVRQVHPSQPCSAHWELPDGCC